MADGPTDPRLRLRGPRGGPVGAPPARIGSHLPGGQAAAARRLPGASAAGRATAGLNAARNLTRSDLSASEKAKEAGAVAVQAAATAVGSPLVGAVVGKLARSRKARWAVVAAVVFMALPLVIAVQSVVFALQPANQLAVVMAGDGGTSAEPCSITVGSVALDAEQSANAAAVISTVQARGLPVADVVLTVATAMTESSLRNVDHGDAAGPDSRGLFQQRDSWGPLEVRMDPAGATGLFLDRLTSPGLKLYRTATRVNSTESSRSSFEPWLVAESVQISAFADGSNYKAHYGQAASVVASVLGDQVLSDETVTAWAAAAGQVLDDGAATGTGCGGAGVGGGGTAPGPWGGYQNGQIPDAALCSVPWQSAIVLRCEAVADLVQLNTAYRAAFGSDLSINQGYRTLAEQQYLWDHPEARTGPAAPPGTSNHGWAEAIDINGTGSSGSSYEARTSTAVYRWMTQHAAAFGWRENLGLREAWHWEWWGTEAPG